MIISNYDALVTINGTGLSGASISSFSKENGLNLISSLGRSFVSQIPDGFSVIAFSVTKPLSISGGEPLLYLTGNDFVSGTIQNDSVSISFESGFLSSYNANYSLNEGPNVTLDFLIYGRIGSNRVNSPSYFSNGNHFAKRSLINIGVSGFEGLLSDFSYSIEVSRVPVFSLGSKHPIEVKTIGPRKFSLRAGGYFEDDFNFESNKFHLSGADETCYLNLSVYGGLSGNILLDSQSGLFNVNSSDVSISSDDEMSFNVEGTRYF